MPEENTKPPPQVWERPPGTRTDKCRSCQEPIWWHRNPATGRAFPVEVATGYNHFINCPHRREWRTKR